MMRALLSRSTRSAGRFLFGRDRRRENGCGRAAAGGASPDNPRSGVAMVEFALAFPMQLLLTFGLVQLMLLMISSLVVNFASYRCCRAAMVNWNGDAEATALKVKPVAQVLLAPLGIAGHRISDTPSGWGADSSSSSVVIPGWGTLVGSDTNINKINITVSDNGGVITTRLSYLQELYFPFIDRLFALVSRTSSTSGRNFAGHTESNGTAWVSGSGRVHVILTRQHTMRRDTFVDNVAEDSEVYQYKFGQ